MEAKMDTNYRLVKRFFGLLLLALFLWGGSFGSMKAVQHTGEGAFTRTYHWEFEDCQYSMAYAIPWETYHFYQEKVRVYPHFAVYTYENRYHRFLDDFVQQLACLAENSGMDRPTTLRFVIAFVQQLEYRNDWGDYPKFPVETLAEFGGDCEDTSILLAAMLKALGYPTVLINPPGHMAMAVACDDCEGVAYRYKGRRYYYVETTARNFGVGQIPEDYLTTEDKILPLDVKPADLWVLYRFVPKRVASGKMLYSVSEDAGLQMAKLQGGKPFLAKTTVRSVKVDGKVSRSRSIALE